MLSRRASPCQNSARQVLVGPWFSAAPQKNICSPQVRLIEKCLSADGVILLPVFPKTNARLLSLREKAR